MTDREFMAGLYNHIALWTIRWGAGLFLGGAAVGAVVVLAAMMATPSQGHDRMAWSDPTRDEWFRSLRTPEKTGRDQISCCDYGDVNPLDPDHVLQDVFGQWYVDLGSGYFKVPPDRVVESPSSIDGLPYLFKRNDGGVRCFVPPVPTY